MANFLAILPNKKADLFSVCLKIYLVAMVLITPLSFPRPLGKSKISQALEKVKPQNLEIFILTPQHIVCYIFRQQFAAAVNESTQSPGDRKKSQALTWD